MSTADRYLAPQIKADLRRKMVFVGGPRQVGRSLKDSSAVLWRGI